jgi:hypothetical protein
MVVRLGCSINGHFRAKNAKNQAQINIISSKKGCMGKNNKHAMHCTLLKTT